MARWLLSRAAANRRFWLAGLGAAAIAAQATPAQAGLIERIRDIMQPSDDLGQAEGTRRGGGTRDICGLRSTSRAIPELPHSEDVDAFFETPVFLENGAVATGRGGRGANPIAGATDNLQQSSENPAAMVAFVPATTDPQPEFASAEMLLEGQTTEAYPYLWLYVPFSSDADSARLRLSVSDQSGQYLFAPVLFDLPASPGVVGLRWADPLPALDPDELYIWMVALRCHDGQFARTLQEVSGLISRSPAPTPVFQASTDYGVFLEEGIWYDMVTQLANQWQAYPAEWGELLTYFQVDAAELPPPIVLHPLGKD